MTSSNGFKLGPMLVHFVTLPSLPNLNSCTPLAGVFPSNHSASLKTVILNGSKPTNPGLREVHFVTLPSAPSLYSCSPSVAGLLPVNHRALLKTVKSPPWNSNKLGPMAVHCVTLPSAPNLNSCSCWLVVSPLNHTAPLNAVRSKGSKPWLA